MTYRNTAERIERALRLTDRILVRDNSIDNIGFAAGANTAAAQGDDPIICFVNPDGELSPECLTALEKAFRDRSIVAAEASQGPDWDRPPAPNGDMDWLSGACLSVRRTAFEAVGGFDERLFMYCEDVDLSYKLAAHGRLVHVADAHFSHDPSTRSFIALHRNYRNWLVVQDRHFTADTERMLRDALFAFRERRWFEGSSRLTGVADYLLRARHWA